MRILVIAVLGVVAIGILAAIGLAPPNPSAEPEVLSTPTTEDVCLTTYLTNSTAAIAALARADADVARSLKGLLAANDDASTRPAIATATVARIAYDDATAELADITAAFQECAP